VSHPRKITSVQRNSASFPRNTTSFLRKRQSIPLLFSNFVLRGVLMSMLASARLTKRLMFAICVLFLSSSISFAQILNVTADQNTPTPGVGHDYFKMLNEIVDPATGQVSIRIGTPVPPDRKLTVPFGFAYDSSGTAFVTSGSNGVTGWS